jgi:hypothetical protein
VRTLTHRLWLHLWTTTPRDTLYQKGRVHVEIEMMLLEVAPREESMRCGPCCSYLRCKSRLGMLKVGKRHQREKMKGTKSTEVVGGRRGLTGLAKNRYHPWIRPVPSRCRCIDGKNNLHICSPGLKRQGQMHWQWYASSVERFPGFSMSKS